MKILAVGDVVFQPGLEILRRKLRAVQKAHGISFTIVNGENASGVGVTPEQVDRILDAGADLVTLGNHVYGKRQIIPYLDDCPYVLRPANYAPQQPGRGWGIFDCAGWRLLVMNLIGRCDMKFGAENPFLMADRILRQNEGQYDFAVCEIHANATSEKLAMGYYLDGKISCLWGTHTHVPTADEQILPGGTGYQTDLGMTGPAHSVIGVRPEQSVAMFRGELTSRFEVAQGKCRLCGALFIIDTATRRCTGVERVMVE